MTRRLSLAAFLVLSLGTTGCAQISQGVSRIAPDSMVSPEARTCASALNAAACAQGMRKAYADRARHVTNEQAFLYDLPTIVLGVASVVVLAFDGAKTLAAGLGIGGASLSAFRTYANAGEQANIYHAAESGVACVEDQLEWFRVNDALNQDYFRIAPGGPRPNQCQDPNWPSTQSYTVRLACWVIEGRAVLAAHDSGTMPINPDELEKALREAAEAGQAAMALARQAGAAMQELEPSAKRALEAIDRGVRKKISDGRPDAEEIVAALKKQAQGRNQATTKSEDVSGATRSSARRIARVARPAPNIEQLIENLNATASAVSDRAPKVVEAFESVGACVAKA